MLQVFLTPLLRQTGKYRQRGVLYEIAAGVYHFSLDLPGPVLVKVLFFFPQLGTVKSKPANRDKLPMYVITCIINDHISTISTPWL